MLSPSPKVLQSVLQEARKDAGLTRAERIAVDVDPVSLL